MVILFINFNKTIKLFLIHWIIVLLFTNFKNLKQNKQKSKLWKVSFNTSRNNVRYIKFSLIKFNSFIAWSSPLSICLIVIIIILINWFKYYVYEWWEKNEINKKKVIKTIFIYFWKKKNPPNFWILGIKKWDEHLF